MHISRWRGAPVSSFLPLLAAVALVAVIWLAVLPSTADAQCGTQMSSCNCHEVKGQLKVNTKGDWHVNHAFGDFCVTCHGGAAKAKDAAPAHAGMMKPVENITAACASCHPADLKTRADRYAKTLGVTVQLGAGAAAAPAGGVAAAAAVAGPMAGIVGQAQPAPRIRGRWAPPDLHVVRDVRVALRRHCQGQRWAHRQAGRQPQSPALSRHAVSARAGRPGFDL